MGAFKNCGGASAIVAFLCLFSSVFAYSGGDGTEAEPYQIGTISDWQQLMSTPTDWNELFIMTADVNLYGIPLTPIGNSTINFTGTLNGDGHIISNAVIHQPGNNYVGLFGCIAGGKIKKLCLKNVDVIGSSYVGGLAGEILTNGPGVYPRIEYCYITGYITGSSYVGGLIGNNSYGTISNCYSAGNVNASSSTAYTGGLVGYNSDSTISNCYSTSDVNAASTSNYAGGLVGYNYGSISDCYSAGSVAAPASHAGGLLGYNGGYNSNCFWDTQTSGLSVGVASGSSTGVIGKITTDMKILSTFAGAGWDISDVNGRDAEWFMYQNGETYPKITFFVYCDYSIPVPLTGDGTQLNPYQISSPQDFITLSQYGAAWRSRIILMADINLSGFTVRPIGNSIVKFTGSFNGQGFVIRNAAINLPNKDIIGLFGSIDDDGLIENLGVEDANVIGTQFIGALAGINSGTLSNCYSTGFIDANSFAYIGGLVGLCFNGTISNCRSTANISGTGSCIGGLVGYNSGGTIVNCRSIGAVTDIDSNDFGSCAGGLVGDNVFGTISKCYSTGSVSAASTSETAYIAIGGLVGDSGYDSIISDSYADSDIFVDCNSSSIDICAGGLAGVKICSDVIGCRSKGNITCNLGDDPNCYAGGLIGLNVWQFVENCYSTSVIAATEFVVPDQNNSDYYIGGLIGSNEDGDVVNCYAAGAVAGSSCAGGLVGYGPSDYVTASFWDTQTTGQSISAGGTGKNTADMKTLSIFTSAGWDFSYADGDPADWFIQVDEYPILTWQISPADLYTDGKNNLKDWAIFAQYWLRDDCAIYNYYCEWADMNFDGYVDIDDLADFISYWLEEGIY
jgi:hypothetical protein